MHDVLTFGLGLPQIARPDAPLADPRAAVLRAESLGFDALWVSEMVRAPSLDPLAVLAHAAALTRRPRLGVAVLLTPLRAPAQLARDLATIDVLSGGRLTVGVGLGGSPDPAARYGISPDGRLRRYLDGLALLRLLWTQDEVAFENRWWRLEGPTNLVRPVQRPHPPIWMGARSARAVCRAVETADAWIGSGSAPWSEFFASLELAHRHVGTIARDPASFTIGKRVYVAVTDDVASIRPRLRAWFGANYGNPSLAEQAALIGDAGACAEQLSRLADRGVRHLLLHPVVDEHEQMEVLAESVIPQVRRR